MCSVVAACNLSFVGTSTDPLSFVLSLNLRRRQLSASQLAFVALEIEKYEAGEAKKQMAAGGGNKTAGMAFMPHPVDDTGTARDKAATEVGVSPRYVQDAKNIQAAAPELAAEVKAGKKTITQAVRAVKQGTDYVSLAAQVVSLPAPVRSKPCGAIQQWPGARG